MTFAARSNTDNKPQVFDHRRRVITEEDNVVYPGGYCRAHLIAFAYEQKTSKGVGFILDMVQFLGGGERLTPITRVEDVFSVEDFLGMPEGEEDLGGTSEAADDDPDPADPASPSMDDLF